MGTFQLVLSNQGSWNASLEDAFGGGYMTPTLALLGFLLLVGLVLSRMFSYVQQEGTSSRLFIIRIESVSNPWLGDDVVGSSFICFKFLA
jgi:hypothetical protein